MFEYSYAILKYRHDFAAGEVLNFGVVMCVPVLGRVCFLYSPKFGRLSEAFNGFDGDAYLSLMGCLQTALDRYAKPEAANLFEQLPREEYTDAGAIMRAVWPDQGLAYFPGSVLCGLTDDPEKEIQRLYERFVLSQQPAHTQVEI